MRCIILALMLTSCAPKHSSLSVADNPTQSPCFDGIMVNIEHSCKNIHMNRIPGFDVLRASCSDNSDKNGWASNTFYFVGNEVHFHKTGWSRICSDPVIDVYFIETHVTVPSLKDDHSK
jgi:hypothetical protein